MIDKVFPPIHNVGYKFLVIFAVATIVLYLISSFLGLIGLILTIWCYYFFRDPERYPINVDEYLVSHYFKRATMLGVLFGNEDYHMKRFSDITQANVSKITDSNTSHIT